MIRGAAPFDPASVGAHYDELDRYYRGLWGEHVHHGLWTTGRESPAEATLCLTRHVAARLALASGARVVDIGAGYGATARLLAAEHGARVTALTVSRAQWAYSRAAPQPDPAPDYLLCEWLGNRLADASFDAALAIESTEHMADPLAAVREAARVLRPGGRLAVCAWIARRDPPVWQRRRLLEPICDEGRLAGMATEGDWRALVADAGLRLLDVDDLSARVARTWSYSALAVARALVRDPAARRYLLDSRNGNRVFALTVLRIRLAYALGAMRYLLFVAERPVA